MLRFTRCILLGLMLVCAFVMPAFTLHAQIAIAQPTLEFSQACASESFNTYDTRFAFNPPSGLDSSNQFIVELSGADGDFTDAIEVFRSDPGTITTSPATVSFSIPTNAYGNGYRIRIKATSPAATSVGSVAFAAYYKLHDTPFTINDLVEDATFCPESGFLLTIDNPGINGDISPLTYDSLTFNWFRAVGATGSVLVGQGDTFLVEEEGTYFAETNYGTCNSQSFSNRVNVSFATGSEPASASITSSLGTLFCSNGEGTTLTTISGDSYEWFRNDEPLAGATENTLQTNDSGNYAVIVTSNGCVAVGSIEIESLSGSTALDVDEINFIQDGESLSVSVNTELSNPSFEWFLNGDVISAATTENFVATRAGLYTVLVSSTGDCDITVELTFELRVIIDATNVPNVITPNGDGINDTWMIPAEYLSGSNTEVVIISSVGKRVLETTEYLNNWPEDLEDIGSGNQVFYYSISPENEEAIKGSITIIF